jgi:REP element-mobilizing transposase RayT
MSRPLRLEFPGAIWHVTSRGNEKRDIVRDDDDRRRFVSLLAHTVLEHRWLLHAWVLMSNHYHLLVETPEVGLSDGVQWLNEMCAMTFNEKYERVGHLFQGRFKGILVEREGHLLELLRYVVLNPVRCGAVQFAADYPWSNYRATAGLEPAPPWLEVEWTLRQFGEDRATAQQRYRNFVADARGASYNPWESLVGQIYLGGEDFCDRVHSMVKSRIRSREHPQRQRRVVRPSMDIVANLVVENFAVTHDALKRKTRGEAKKALAMLAADEAGLSLRTIGEWMGVTDWAVSKMRSAGRELYERDRRYRERVDRILDVLS